VGFTRSSCNFCHIANSLPAFVESMYLHQSASKDIIKRIGTAFHPSVFGHSSVLVVHMQGALRMAVMEKLSRSTTSMPLGVPLPQCPTCEEEHFSVGTIHSGKLNIQCKGCNTRAEHIVLLPALIVSSMQTEGAFSLLPYPLPNPLPNSLKIIWPQKSSTEVKQPSKRQNKNAMQMVVGGSAQFNALPGGMVKTFSIQWFVFLLLLTVLPLLRRCRRYGAMLPSKVQFC
jgi:hypothetical protein